MRNHMTETIEAGVWKASAVSERLYRSLIRTSVLNLIGQIAIGTPIATQTLPHARPAPIDRQVEIALPLSACPPSVANKAAVYVLEISGYVKIRDGENGFPAIVRHSQPTRQEPQCMHAEGTRTFLPRYLKVAESEQSESRSQSLKRYGRRQEN